ncbi:MAG TPA: N-6 DNA methylase, partial [Methylomirabilota bacterium]|nr:N-6 DNA methylase [Methylomirabilota bacterium]
MNSFVQLPDQNESSRSFLDEAYQVLDYEKGALFNALSFPNSATDESEEWLEKGDWLALAQEVGAKKLFFVNDDPVIVFCELPNSRDVEAQIDMFRRVWCMARPQCLFMAFPDELRVYSLNRPPAQNGNEWEKVEPLKLVKHLADVAEKLHDYRREQVESGRLFADDRFGSIDERADKRLIQDLKIVRQLLLNRGLNAKYAHALIGRSIFIRYLEDREILTPTYFGQVARENPYWQELLSRKPEKPVLMPDWEKRRYYNVLLDKDFTYALFVQLAHDFNGDMFPKDGEEERTVDQKDHLEPLRDFLLGDPDPWQSTLFFWAYDFKIIPIELISSIYEEFYHGSNIEDANGTHYTPSVLVEYLLSQVLTQERLATNPKILDPACGSGIFLVESFRRIVRYQVKRQQRLLLSEELRQILRDQITGIEINEEAIRVAAFSLYLALLHYQEPRDILENKRLPNLIYIKDKEKDEQYYNLLFNANAFGLTPEEKNELEGDIRQKKIFKGRANLQLLLNAEQNLDVKLHSFDVVVGNPPWSEVSKYINPLPCDDLPLLYEVPKPFRYDKQSHTLTITDQVRLTDLAKVKQILPSELHEPLNKLKQQSDECFQAIRWAEAYKKPVGDNSYSQLFIYRSLSFIKENGIIGLLVHSSVLFNERRTSREFRQVWLSSSKIHQIVNFAHVRRLFFNKSVAPFFFTSFESSQADLEDHYIVYTSALLTKAAEQLRSVILTKADRRIVRQSELQERDYLWKTYWWGNHRDAALLATLDMEYRLQDFLSADPKPGYGFQKGNIPPSETLRKLRSLKSKNLKWYGPLEDKWFEEPPTGTSRQPDERLYHGQRLLVVEGIKSLTGICARLEYDDFSFRHTIYCIPLPF